MMDTGVKIVVTAICAVILLAVLKKGGGEFTLPVILTAGGCIFCYIAGELARLTAAVNRFTKVAHMDLWVVEVVVKVVVISLITKIAVEICKGAGEGGLAAMVDTAGTVLALAGALPLVQEVVDMVVEMLI